MADKTTSQSQQSSPTQIPADPFGLGAWRKMTEDHLARVEALCTELGRLETRGSDQARFAVDETSKLMHESLRYATELSGQWRSMMLDGLRRGARFGETAG